MQRFTLLILLIFFISFPFIYAKGGGGGVGGRVSGGRSSGSRNSDNKSSKTEKASNTNRPNGNTNKQTTAKSANNDIPDKKSSKFGKGALVAGGLLAAGGIGYSLGRSHHYSEKCMKKHDNEKPPREVNETFCCPSLPPPLKADLSSCNCTTEEESETNEYLCIVQCTLEHNGWLTENGTIDKEMASDTISNSSTNKKSWTQAVSSLVNACINAGNKLVDDTANVTALELLNLDVARCIDRNLFALCPTTERVDTPDCNKLFKYHKACAELSPQKNHDEDKI